MDNTRMELSDTPDLAFSRETYNRFLNEASHLFKTHWEEVALFKEERELQINHAGYFLQESQNRLAVFVVRSGKEIVGYAIFVFAVSLHYSSPVAMNDAFYLHPDYRKGWTALRFIKYCIKQLHLTPAEQLIWRTKSHQSFAPLLERCGMQEDDISYSMLLKGQKNG